MNMSKPFLLMTASLLFLGACSSASNPTSAPVSSMASSPASLPKASPAASSAPAAPGGKAQHGAELKSGGGIVVESSGYHIELVPEKAGGVTHLDLFLQKHDTHEPVPNAKVMAQIQLPDGSQKSAEMTYDVDAKHYTANLDSVAAGEYKVTVQSTIGEEKVNARYTFKQ
jgi:hypothetical protein